MILIGLLEDKTFGKGLNTKILGNLRNINYEAKNVDLYKKDPTSESVWSFRFFK